MNANTPVDQANGKSDMTRAIVRRLVQVVIQYLFIAAILFISSWRLDWVWTWVYLGVGVGLLLINALVLPSEVIAERGRTDTKDVKSWDRVLTTLSIFPTLSTLVVAGLDVRFGWSPQLHPAIHLVALAGMVLGQGLFTWSMASNKFFSTAVRVQMDRDHIVATGGPYRYVRHPGYVGYIVLMLSTPVILGSLWGLIPAVLTACLFVVRTALEDRTLQEELPGYKDYAQQVRHRLLPGLW